MLRRVFVLLSWLVLLGAGVGVPRLYANSSAQDWCEQGNRTVSTSNLASTTKVQQSFPACTVTVYLNGVSPATKATIYSDNATPPTPLANPFTASANGLWQFFAIDGHYDVVMSGAGFPSPVTIRNIAVGGVTLDCATYTSPQIKNCLTALSSTGGVADASRTTSQTIAANPYSGVVAVTKLLLNPKAAYAVSSEINPTIDYTSIDCQGSALTASASISVVRWSLAYGDLANCRISGADISGTSGLRVAPVSESQTSTVVYTNFGSFRNLLIEEADEGVVLAMGPTVMGAQSDNSFSAFDHVTLRNNKRGIWLKAHPTTASPASPDTNYWSGITCYSTSARTNTCLQIDAGSTNRFFGLSCNGMVNGTSPNATPTCFYLAGGVTGGLDNNSNLIVGGRAETNTRCINVASSRANYNSINIDGQCDDTKIVDNGTSTGIHSSPNVDKNGIWYSYTSTTGTLTISTANDVTISPVNDVTLSPSADVNLTPVVGDVNLTASATKRVVVRTGLYAYFIAPSSTDPGVYILKSGAPNTNQPALRIDNGFAGGTKVWETTLDGNTTSTGISLYRLTQTTPGLYPGDLPTCNSSTEGTIKPITNSNTAVWGAVISGIGANHVLAYCNGTDFTVIGK